MPEKFPRKKEDMPEPGLTAGKAMAEALQHGRKHRRMKGETIQEKVVRELGEEYNRMQAEKTSKDSTDPEEKLRAVNDDMVQDLADFEDQIEAEDSNKRNKK
ncbi:MAG: hypothetical protein KGI60_04575 [Patescibacteria group bacterium]|nr:hypothetical protein [Patescibacteria group bacterium]